MAERYCVSHALRSVCEQHYNDDDRRSDAEFMRNYNQQDEGAAAPTRQELERAMLAEVGANAAEQQVITDAHTVPRAVFHFHEPMHDADSWVSSSNLVRALGSRLFLSALPIVRSQNVQERRRHPVQTRAQRTDELQDRVRSLNNMVPRDLRMWTRADPSLAGPDDTLTYTLYREQMDEPMRRMFYTSMRHIGVSCRRVNDGYRLTLPANNRERFVNDP
jgi:hypothetical protein